MTGTPHPHEGRPARPSAPLFMVLAAALAVWTPQAGQAESPYTTTKPSPAPTTTAPAPGTPGYKPARVPGSTGLPQTPTSEPLDTGRPPSASMQLKDKMQINLLNTLAVTDMSDWPKTLKKNRPLVNEEFIRVVALRGQDAFALALSNRRNEREARRYFEIAFRYMLLADLCGEEIHLKTNHRVELARKCAQGGARDLALAICKNVLVLEKDNIVAHNLAGDLHMDAGAFFEALEDYKAVVKKEPNNEKAWTKIAYIYWFLHDLPRTGDALKKTLAINPNNRDAKSLQYKLDHPDQPPSPDQLPPLGPENAGTPQQIADGLAAKGIQFLSAGNLIDAEKEFRSALQTNPNCASAHMGMGDLHFRSSRFQSAVDEYLLAAKFAPSNAEPLRYLALSCEKIYDQSGDVLWLDRAIGYVKDAIVRQSNYPAARADQERLLEKKTRLIVPRK